MHGFRGPHGKLYSAAGEIGRYRVRRPVRLHGLRARCGARVGRRWVRNLYRFAMHPNIAFYFRVPLDVALGRILGGAMR